MAVITTPAIMLNKCNNVCVSIQEHTAVTYCKTVKYHSIGNRIKLLSDTPDIDASVEWSICEQCMKQTIFLTV